MDSISQTSMRGDSVQLPRPLPPPFPSTAASPPPLPERRPPPRIRYERYAGEEVRRHQLCHLKRNDMRNID